MGKFSDMLIGVLFTALESHIRRMEEKEQALRERYEDHDRSARLQAQLIDYIVARAAIVGRPLKISLPYPYNMDCLD